MNVKEFAIFQELAETLNLSRSAAKLHTSQPRLSQQLAKFERQLGVSLFERTSRGLRLSHAGGVLSPYATEIARVYAEAVGALARLEGSCRRELRLGVIQVTSVSCLSELLHLFHARHPEVRVIAVKTALSTMFSQLDSGELDLCLCFEPPDCGRFSWQSIFTTSLAGVSSAGSGLPAEASLTDFCKQPLVLLSRRCSSRLSLDRAFKRLNIEPTVKIEMDDVAALTSFVKAGGAVTILPERMIPLSRMLRRTQLREPRITVVGGVLHRPDPSFTVLRFIETVAMHDAHLAAGAKIDPESSGLGRPLSPPSDAVPRVRREFFTQEKSQL